jgi:hypothetical protein
MNSIRYLVDYYNLRKWEEKTSFKGVHRPSRIFTMSRRIPWSSVAFLIFCTIFFGIDFYAGVRNTIDNLKEGKLDQESRLVLKSHEQRRWSMEEGRKFRDGERE